MVSGGVCGVLWGEEPGGDGFTGGNCNNLNLLTIPVGGGQSVRVLKDGTITLTCM